MATAQVTPDNDVVVAEIFIAAPPARVFEAITDPKQASQWWGQKGLYRLTSTQGDFRVGGKYRNEGVSEDGKTFSVEGEYLEIDPPRLLVHTWLSSYSYVGNLSSATSTAYSITDLRVSAPAPCLKFATPDSPATSRPRKATVTVGSASSAGCKPSSKRARPWRLGV